MLLAYKRGQQSIILRIKILDSSASDGSGLIGLTSSSSGLLISTIADNESTAVVYSGSNIETITTLGTFSAPSSGKVGFKEVDSTNHKGIYELQIVNSRFAVTSAKSLLISISGAANCVQTDFVVALTDLDPYDSIRAGLTALPNVSSGTAGAVITSGTGTSQLSVNSGFVIGNTIRTGTAQAGNSNSITLDSSASSTNDLYKGQTVQILSGTGVGQARTIVNYNGNTKSATIDRSWAISPNNTSIFVIYPDNNPRLNANLQVTSGITITTLFSGTAQSGTINTITLPNTASTTNNIYVGNIISLTSGAGLGQTRTIISYNGTTKIVTVDRNWNTQPDNTTVFDITASINPTVFSDQGVAQNGTNNTITLQSTASSTNDIYNGSLVTILSGTGVGQTREIEDYVGSTKVATVSIDWDTNPDSTSAYSILPTVAATGTFPSVIDANIISWASNPVTWDSAPLVQLADGVAHGGTPGSSTATLALDHAYLKSATEHAFACESIADGKNGILAYGSHINGYGATFSGGVTGLILYGSNVGLSCFGDTGIGMSVGTYTGGPAFSCYSEDGHGVSITAAGFGNHDIHLAGSGTIHDGVNNNYVKTLIVETVTELLNQIKFAALNK